MPSACASATASHAWRTWSTASRTGSGPLVSNHAREIAALEVLHHHVRRAGLERADVDDARDVLALDLRRGARLAGEARDDLGVRRGLRQEELERDALAELEVHRRDDDAHPAAAEDALDPVLAGEDVARSRSAGAFIGRRDTRHDVLGGRAYTTRSNDAGAAC